MIARPSFQLTGTGALGRDPMLFTLILGLAFLGLLALYPASALLSESARGDAAFFINRQTLWFIPAVIAMLALAVMPAEILRRLAPFGLLFTLLLLALVFVPGLGYVVHSGNDAGFHRWLRIGPYTFQPSELAKPALVLYLADVLSRGDRLVQEYDLRRLIAPLALVALVLVAIVLEPQFGTTLCLSAVVGTMIFVSGFPILRLLVLGLSFAPIPYMLAYLTPYRWARVQVWLDPYAYRYEGGYQLVTSFRAFQEGGILGQPLGGGFAHRYLTYGHSDFVLALFAEDWGLAGITMLVGLFLALLFRGFQLLKRVTDPFALMLGTGALVMLFYQILLNMCVVTGLVPTTGISLPFFSSGGSSLLATLMLCGLLINATGRSE